MPILVLRKARVDRVEPFADCGPFLVPVRPIAPVDTTPPFADCGPFLTPVRPIPPVVLDSWSPPDGTAQSWYTAEQESVGTVTSLSDQIVPLTDFGDIEGPFNYTPNTGTTTVAAAQLNGMNGIVFSNSSLRNTQAKNVKAAMFLVSGLQGGNNPIISSAGNNPADHLVVNGTSSNISADGSGGWAGASVDGSELRVSPVNGDITPASPLSTTGPHIIYVTYNDPAEIEFIGANGTASGNFILHEAIFWDLQPSLLEVEYAEGWLQHNWGLSVLPASHPYATVAPQIGDKPTRAGAVTTTAALINAIDNAVPGERIFVGAGTFSFTESKAIPPMAEIVGTGDTTVIEGDLSWAPGFDDVPNLNTEEFTAYLFGIGTDASRTGSCGWTCLKMEAPLLHGAVVITSDRYCYFHKVTIERTGYGGIRDNRGTGTYMQECTFIDAGRRRGEGGGDYYATACTSPTERNCLHIDGSSPRSRVGFKAQGCDFARLLFNEYLGTTFSIEVPHVNRDEDNRVYGCIMFGATSLPKHSSGGGASSGFASTFTRNPDGTATANGGIRSWWLRHCRFESSYGVEGPRNPVDIDTCVMLDERGDVDQYYFRNYNGTNANAGYQHRGPVIIHDSYMRVNLGVLFAHGTTTGIAKLTVTNNLIEQRTGTNPQGFFNLAEQSNHATNYIGNNIFDASDLATNMFTNAASRTGTNVENNTLINVSDSGGFSNPSTGNPIGPVAVPTFLCGINQRWQVTGFNKTPA